MGEAAQEQACDGCVQFGDEAGSGTAAVDDLAVFLPPRERTHMLVQTADHRTDVCGRGRLRRADSPLRFVGNDGALRGTKASGTVEGGVDLGGAMGDGFFGGEPAVSSPTQSTGVSPLR